MKGLRVTKIVKEIKFEGVWGRLRSNKMFPEMKIFFLVFMSLLTAPIDKNSHIKARIYFIFLKIFLKQTWKSFNAKFQGQ